MEKPPSLPVPLEVLDTHFLNKCISEQEVLLDDENVGFGLMRMSIDSQVESQGRTWSLRRLVGPQ